MYIDDPKIKIFQICQTSQIIEYTITYFSVDVQNIITTLHTRLNENHYKVSSDFCDSVGLLLIIEHSQHFTMQVW